MNAPTLFPRTRVKPGDEADSTSLISSSKQAPGMRQSRRLTRKPVVIVRSVCSGANAEHVAAVRQPAGLRCPA